MSAEQEGGSEADASSRSQPSGRSDSPGPTAPRPTLPLPPPGRWRWALLIGLLVLLGVVLAIADIGLKTPMGPYGSAMLISRPQVSAFPSSNRFDRSKIAERFTFVGPFGPLNPISPGRALQGFLSDGAGLILLALGALLLFPNRARTAVQRLEARYGLPIAMAAGVATFLLTLAATGLLRFTLIFLAVIPVVLVVALAAAMFGIACIALGLGRLLQRRLPLGPAHPLVAALAGALIVFDLAVIPYLGFFALAVVAIGGLGLAVVTRFGSETGWSFTDLRW